MLTLYHAHECPFCVRTRIVLREKGIAHDEVLIDLGDRDPALRRLNPRNRVPTVVDGDLVLYESHIVDEYLDEAYDGPALMPESPAGRARVRLAIDRFDDFSDAYYALRRAVRGDDDAAADAARRAVAAQLAQLDEALAAEPYLAGDEYTLADPSWWPWVARLPALGVDVPEFGNLAAWTIRLESRPAVAAELALR